MKILFLSSQAHRALDPTEKRVSGGAELQVALLARALAQRGHEVVVAGGDTGQPADRVLQGVRMRTAGPFHTGRLADTLAALPKVFALLREHRPDYVGVLGWTAWLDVLAGLRRLFGYRLIYICGLDPEIDGSFGRTRGWRGRLFERGVRRSDVRFAMSGYQGELFRRAGLAHGFYRNLILPRRSPPTAEKNIDLLWVARCQPIKRPHLFLDLAERLPAVRCEMVCPREDIALWESVSARAAGLSNVVFRESVPYAEIQARYDAAKFLVSTSEAEGFPNNMIQAAQGEAGILSLEVDPDGLIGKFEAGVCAGRDFERLVEETERLLSDPVAAAAAGQGALRMVTEWLDNEANTEAFLRGLDQT